MYYPTIVGETEALEFCVVLSEKPTTNIVEFGIEGDNLIFTKTGDNYTVSYESSSQYGGIERSDEIKMVNTSISNK
jgi:hypothetical protein